MMRECDLLVTGPSPRYREELTTKLYDYLDAGRPIIGLTPSGTFMDEFLRASGVGWACSPGDVAGIRALLLTLQQNGASLFPNQSYLSSHTLASVGNAVSKLVDRIASNA